MSRNYKEIYNEGVAKLLKMAGSTNRAEREAGMAGLAEAISQPLREGVLIGNNLENIYEVIQLGPNAATDPEFALDLISPGTEGQHVAYTIPQYGRLPEQHFEADYVKVPTYKIGNSVDTSLDIADAGNPWIVSRLMEVLEAGITKKMNDDGWHVLMSAGVDRNILVYDGDANAGQFTKRLLSLMKVTFRRNGGGNTPSINRSKLTDIWMSPEGIEDIRNWNVDQVDETTRREIFLSDDGSGTLSRIFGVNLNPMDELGPNQEYQKFFTDQLGGSLQAADSELIIGLDLSKDDSFVSPRRRDVEVFERTSLHEFQRMGFYAWGFMGFGVLDNRRVILGSF